MQTVRTDRRKPAFGPTICILLALIAGCGDSKPVAEPPPVRPLRAMNSAIRKGLWQDAWTYRDQVLAEHAESPDAIASVARVAFELGKTEEAADLLAEACRVDSFRDPARVQQAMVAMIGVGQLYEAIEMLQQAVEAQPEQHATRRALFDLAMGSELRLVGVPHGRTLIRARQFDLELLDTLSNAERRSQEFASMEEMISRNPDDKRPLIGKAKYELDQGQSESASKILETIIEHHPDHLPAQSLYARTLAALGQFESLQQWADEAPEGIQQYPGYWLALGDWSRWKQDSPSAARAYWEATQLDPDIPEAWSKLATELRQALPQPSPEEQTLLSAVERRAEMLSALSQQRNRFDRSGRVSRAIVLDIAQKLQQLGRLWEAEAWAAVAPSLPEDDAVDPGKVRASIVAELKPDTPWQLTEGFPELRTRLDYLPAPAIAQVTSAIAQQERRSEKKASQLRLVNEANERGLRFFGRTADDLDQPGIMLFETLGCGGGSVDFDLDGWTDLYLLAAGGTPPAKDSAPNALMRNLGGQFTDVTEAAGTGDRGFSQGVAVGDVNEDGFPDLLVLNYGPNALLINNGDGTFRDASQQLPRNDDRWSTAGAIADLDGDTLNDIAIVNYCAGLEPLTVTCGTGGSCSPMRFPGESDQFLQGQPDGKILDRTAAWMAEPAVIGRGLGIVAGDFDDRLGIDVLVANDMTNNHYWSRGESSSSFQLSESAMPRGVGADDRSLAQGSMGIAAADFDIDGDIDFYITNFQKEYNSLHSHRSPGVWQDVTSALGLAAPTLPLVGFGTEAVDFDHDGTLELIVTNGHVDMFARGEERSVYSQPMQVFQRDASGGYQEIALEQPDEYMSRVHVGRALWTIDANRDGMLDLVVTHQTEPTALLMNHSNPKGNWIAVQLIGTTSSRDAIGSKVVVKSGEGVFAGFQISGDGYMCSNERILRFGLGAGDESCELQITWPDGSNQIHSGLARGRIWQIVQGSDATEQ